MSLRGTAESRRKERRARSGVENRVITRARIVTLAGLLIPRDDTGYETATVSLPYDRRRSNDARRHVARLRLQRLKIHLRGRERINGRVERADLAGSALASTINSPVIGTV